MHSMLNCHARNFRILASARNFRLCPAQKTRPLSPHVSIQTASAHTTSAAAGSPLCCRFCPRPTPTVPPHLFPPPPGRCFHASPRRGAVPAPLLWLVLKPLQKVAAMLLGRSLRKWWKALPENRRELMRDWVLRRRWHLTAGGAVAVVIVALLLLTHLDESPLTGRVRLLLFSKEAYLELAALTAEGVRQEGTMKVLAERNKDIPKVSERPWSVHVVKKSQINAFVLPNGKVFVFTGMLDAVADADQLTIVLGHEMAHVILDHSAEQASLSHIVDLLSLLLLTAIWALCPTDTMALLGGWAKDKLAELMFQRPYSRKLEVEADQIGLQLAAKACADVRAGPVFWQQLEITDRLSGELTLPEWLSTHPSHRNRTAQLDRLIPQALELRESCLCPALPSTDPRVVFQKTVRVLLEKAKVPVQKKMHMPTLNISVCLFQILKEVLF
uniref:Metalloendopeptidase OMA1, mitochondrial n=1 Tax=Oryzias sinensis TaxID=183150 RepID=A0A8C7Y8Y1_9TELE